MSVGRTLALVAWAAFVPLTADAHAGVQLDVAAETAPEELARLIPGAEIKIFPRGGHFLTQVQAREFNNAVLPFLVSHTPA